MHSLADYTYNDIRAAVLSFIQKHETGTYALKEHWLQCTYTNHRYYVVYVIGPHMWKFRFWATEVNQPGIKN
jgi:hypothetical protein